MMRERERGQNCILINKTMKARVLCMDVESSRTCSIADRLKFLIFCKYISLCMYIYVSPTHTLCVV